MSDTSSGSRAGAVLEAIVWWATGVAVWQATVTTPSVQEWVAAALFAAPVAVCARAARHAARGSWRLPAESILLSARLIPAILADSAGAMWLAVRRRGAGGEFAQLPMPLEPAEARRAGREAMTTVLTCATPGALVVGADRERQCLHVHTLPLPPTAMARRMRRSTATGDRR
ncbi:Na+/H+ antiporter subunit E [Nocardia miyunensis]|uniref:Na+/H+ antiporter subunit E n=1 Tax=Nocardia miyunensis TaxID=282684 RepID=UPI000831B500|nr:Na+/H+ antiporter subunit E [Nocardia miyunensis]